MTHVVVTGGAGFIGSHLVDALLAQHYSVTILDDLSTGFEENLADASAARFIAGSVLNEQRLDEALQGADTVFHLAAIPSVPRSIRDPLLSHAVNATGTLMVLEACRRARVSRVVYAASSSAQGELGDRPRSEWLLGRPRSPYAVAKYTGELYGAVYHAIHGIQVVSLRYFNVYGPRQRLRGPYSNVIPSFLAAGLRGRPALIYGDGLQTRDFTYVEDVVQATLLAMNAASAPGNTINVGPGCPVTIRDLANMVGRVLKCSMTIQYAAARAEDVYHMCADQTLARELLGFYPSTAIEDGLRNTAAWLRNHVGETA
jgi:UDP-glucose 4-epimerase